MKVTASKAYPQGAMLAISYSPHTTSRPCTLAAIFAINITFATSATKPEEADSRNNTLHKQTQDKMANAETAKQLLDTSEPQISHTLYQKASEKNNELTKAERLLFLSRRDLIGKAFYSPNDLTEAQCNEVLGRPPPEMLKATLTSTFEVDTIAEVMQKYWSPDRTEHLTFKELSVITQNWWTWDADFLCGSENEAEDTPAATYASLLLQRHVPEETFFEDAVMERFCNIVMPDDENEAPSNDLYDEEADVRDQMVAADLEGMRQKSLKLKAEKDAERAKLASDMQAHLEKEIGGLSDEDVTALRELLDRMVVEVPRDEEENAKAKAATIAQMEADGLSDDDFDEDEDEDEDDE